LHEYNSPVFVVKVSFFARDCPRSVFARRLLVNTFFCHYCTERHVISSTCRLKFPSCFPADKSYQWMWNGFKIRQCIVETKYFTLTAAISFRESDQQPPTVMFSRHRYKGRCLLGIVIVAGNFTVRVYYVLPDLSGLNCILSRAICLKFICLFSKIRFYSSEEHRSFISALN
jgi:hypothetical protein